MPINRLKNKGERARRARATRARGPRGRWRPACTCYTRRRTRGWSRRRSRGTPRCAGPGPEAGPNKKRPDTWCSKLLGKNYPTKDERTKKTELKLSHSKKVGEGSNKALPKAKSSETARNARNEVSDQSVGTYGSRSCSSVSRVE